MMIVVSVLFLLVAFWIFKCCQTVQPNEIGMKVRLGKSNDTSEASGFHWIWWPIEWLVKFPREIMEFKLKVRSIITRKGWVKGYSTEIEPADINILATFYCRFDEEKILKAIQYAPGKNAPELGPYLTPFVADAVRSLAGRLPWRLTNQERFRFSQWVEARLEGGTYADIVGAGTQNSPCKFDTRPKELRLLTVFDKDVCAYGKYCGQDMVAIINSGDFKQKHIQRMDPPSPFITIGLTDVSFAIEDINFSNDELVKSISAPEKARLDGEAMILTAEATKTKKIKEGEGDSIARKAMLDVVAGKPELEALRTLAEMAQGKSNTIFHSLPNDFLAASFQKLITQTKEGTEKKEGKDGEQ